MSAICLYFYYAFFVYIYEAKIQMRLFLVIFSTFFVIYNKVAFFFYVHSCRRELHQTNLEDDHLLDILRTKDAQVNTTEI